MTYCLCPAFSYSSRSAFFDRDAYGAWLKRLRQVCAEKGIVLIFDEVFVGFRLARGGAQEYFGVRADLVTYGKTLARASLAYSTVAYPSAFGVLLWGETLPWAGWVGVILIVGSGLLATVLSPGRSS